VGVDCDTIGGELERIAGEVEGWWEFGEVADSEDTGGRATTLFIAVAEETVEATRSL